MGGGVASRGINNRISIQSKLHHFRIIVDGNNNEVVIGPNCIMHRSSIIIYGDNNRLIIDDEVKLFGGAKIILQGNGSLHIKHRAGIRDTSFLSQGASITIGEWCMFSYGIEVRNTDSHRIFQVGSNAQINHPKDIILGNHVWIGKNATILKGVTIGHDSIIAMGSVVTKSCEPNSILAGNPAKVVKTDITWDY